MQDEVKDLKLDSLATETNNAATSSIDREDTLEIVRMINREDRLIALAVERELRDVAKAVDYIAAAFKHGGRLIYVGAGTSGRLGVLDASECKPTYGVDCVQGFIAGGDVALRHAVEGAEDSFTDGVALIDSLNIKENDVVVGITASGRTQYVLGAIARANDKNATTIGVCNNMRTQLHGVCDITIAPVVGPEVVQGSTRMKSGSAQKMVLNMLSTASMIKAGKVYKNCMVDMQPSNEKLYDRAIRLVMQVTDADRSEAQTVLQTCDYHVKTAIVMIKLDCTETEARIKLLKADGYVAKALGEVE
ncbi:MAG: N-acetylmuramic acid 6-phosphate etherase [Epulopiscium sp. Nuni2H_MBin001]|nr:MAG: N-acetylmuramic acid 6-phosphate etherase [Epulopiscium sp. Nuni2H_MBin001]